MSDGHSTSNEIAYIDGLGSHQNRTGRDKRPQPGKADRRQLLIDYLTIACKRERWGEIDKEKVLAHVRELLD